jgi:hypothetical protein
MTMPTYGGSTGYTGNLIEFRLGSLFDKRKAFIESLSYSMSDETPWDIDINKDLGELPMGIDIQIGLKILGPKPYAGKSMKVYDTDFKEEQAAAVTGDTLFDGDVTPASGFGSGNLSQGFGGFG